MLSLFLLILCWSIMLIFTDWTILDWFWMWLSVLPSHSHCSFPISTLLYSNVSLFYFLPFLPTFWFHLIICSYTHQLKLHQFREHIWLCQCAPRRSWCGNLSSIEWNIGYCFVLICMLCSRTLPWLHQLYSLLQFHLFPHSLLQHFLIQISLASVPEVTKTS